MTKILHFKTQPPLLSLSLHHWSVQYSAVHCSDIEHQNEFHLGMWVGSSGSQGLKSTYTGLSTLCSLETPALEILPENCLLIFFSSTCCSPKWPLSPATVQQVQKEEPKPGQVRKVFKWSEIKWSCKLQKNHLKFVQKFETFSLSPFPCLPITSAPHLIQNTSTHLPSSKSWLLNVSFPCNLGFCVDYIFVFFIIGRIPVKFPLRPHNCHTRGAFCHTGGVTLEFGNYFSCCSVDQRLLPVSKIQLFSVWFHCNLTKTHLHDREAFTIW